MTTVNSQLIDSLAQVILSLSQEEQHLLSQRLQALSSETQQPSSSELAQFFQALDTLPDDPEEPSLDGISRVVKEVRHGLWLTE